jgi:hypothetical protein
MLVDYYFFYQMMQPTGPQSARMTVFEKTVRIASNESGSVPIQNSMIDLFF